MERRDLPPLNALRAFEAAARLGGFQQAAVELCVTPGAVSQQVKRLEEWFGEALFVRHVRGVSLTATAAQLQPKLTRLLDEAETVCLAHRTRRQPKRLVINALPAFAERWLLPRLQSFQAAHPDVELEIQAEDAMPDFSAGIDVGLRYLDAPLEGTFCHRLMEDRLFPVASPDLAEGLTLRDLGSKPLLYDVAWKNDWRLWWRAAGLPGDPPVGTRFSLYSMAMQSAVNGGGVLMAHAALVERELEKGGLVAPFDEIADAPGAFYFLCDPARRDEGEIAKFFDWIRDQGAQAGGA